MRLGAIFGGSSDVATESSPLYRWDNPVKRRRGRATALDWLFRGQHAMVTQSAECLPSKQDVEGSIPSRRSGQVETWHTME